MKIVQNSDKAMREILTHFGENKNIALSYLEKNEDVRC